MFEFDPKISWGTIIQFIGFVVGIGVVSYQLHKQRQLQKENHLIQIRREIYKEVTDRMELASPSGVSITLNLLVGALEKARKRKEETGTYRPLPFCTEDIVNDFRKVQSNLFRISRTIEKYEIIGENQSLFRRALVAKITELSASFMPIIFVLPYILLSSSGISDSEKLLIPTESELKDFQTQINQFNEIALDLNGFLYDIQVEAQNALLGSLFSRKLEIRKPEDTKSLVLTSQNLGEVKAYVDTKESGQ